MFYREVAARTYSFLPYSLAEATIELPYLLFQGIIFTVVLYWLVDFPTSAPNVFIFMLAVCLNNACVRCLPAFLIVGSYSMPCQNVQLSVCQHLTPLTERRAPSRRSLHLLGSSWST